jgi:hypothetical protein
MGLGTGFYMTVSCHRLLGSYKGNCLLYQDFSKEMKKTKTPALVAMAIQAIGMLK